MSNTSKRLSAEKFCLIWLDGNIDRTQADYQNSISKLEQIVGVVHIFTDVDACMNLVKRTWNTVIIIISGRMSEFVLPMLQPMRQVSSVYIFCQNYLKYEKQAAEWPIVKGVCTDIVSICIVLRKIIEASHSDDVSISSIKSNATAEDCDLNRLDCSFTYTKILIEILLTMESDQANMQEFSTYCRQIFAGNARALRFADEFERDYRPERAIWWFTRDCFINLILSKSLRTMDMDPIFKMGFFVRDLHNQITALHTQQYDQSNNSDSFIVYRGQCLSQADFEKFKTGQGGLLAFNQFLSTSVNRDVSLKFAHRAMRSANPVGILFTMTIIPTISTPSFASVKDIGYYLKEEEILFSTHSVFRIGKVQQIKENERLWEVQLTLTDDKDQHLLPMMRMMHMGIQNSTPLFRIGRLMREAAQLTTAEQIFQTLLHQTFEEVDQGQIYSELGTIKLEQGDYPMALSYHEKTLAVQRKTLPANHPNVATSYTNIGLLYCKIGEYLKALSCYEKALEIQQKTLPTNHPYLAISYNNMGLNYSKTGEYSKALSFYDKALEIQEKTLPTNHPNMATSYDNMGLVFFEAGEYLRALSCYEKALEIQQKTLPANHPDLATSYNHMSLVCLEMGEYSKAFSHCEKALEIQQRTLPANHPDLATSYNNIGLGYSELKEYSKAFSFYEKALEIQQKAFPANHPDLATSYHNMSLVYLEMGEYSKALSCCEKAVEMRQKSLPPYHPDMATSYNSMGKIYSKTGESSKALQYFERALDTLQRSELSSHPRIRNVKMNIAALNQSL